MNATSCAKDTDCSAKARCLANVCTCYWVYGTSGDDCSRLTWASAPMLAVRAVSAALFALLLLCSLLMLRRGCRRAYQMTPLTFLPPGCLFMACAALLAEQLVALLLMNNLISLHAHTFSMLHTALAGLGMGFAVLSFLSIGIAWLETARGSEAFHSSQKHLAQTKRALTVYASGYTALLLLLVAATPAWPQVAFLCLSALALFSSMLVGTTFYIGSRRLATALAVSAVCGGSVQEGRLQALLSADSDHAQLPSCRLLSTYSSALSATRSDPSTDILVANTPRDSHDVYVVDRFVRISRAGLSISLHMLVLGVGFGIFLLSFSLVHHRWLYWTGVTCIYIFGAAGSMLQLMRYLFTTLKAQHTRHESFAELHRGSFSSQRQSWFRSSRSTDAPEDLDDTSVEPVGLRACPQEERTVAGWQPPRHEQMSAEI